MTISTAVPSTLPDLDAAAEHAREFLTALGVDCNTPGMRTSPLRMATAYLEMLSSDPFSMTTFPNDDAYSELVIVRAIPVRSLCEHHLLPFTGIAHIGYLPGERILGLSKFARVVEKFAHRPQTQERLTQQIVNSLDTALDARGIGVVIEAEHSCMTLRGVRAPGTSTRTSAFTGELREPAARHDFLTAIAD